MKFDDCIYKEITWFNADEIVEHETFDGIDSYELLRNLAMLEAGYSLDDRLDDEAVELAGEGFLCRVPLLPVRREDKGQHQRRRGGKHARKAR